MNKDIAEDWVNISNSIKSDETPSKDLDEPELNYEEVYSSSGAIKVVDDLSAVLQQRGSRYGEFKDNAYVSQQLKSIISSGSNYDLLDPDMKESLDMIAHKIARILEGDPFYDDSWIDIAGYAKLVANRLQNRLQGVSNEPK